MKKQSEAKKWQTSAVALAVAGASAAIGGLVSSPAYASHTSIRSDYYVQQGSQLPPSVFDIRHEVTKDDMLTDDEIGQHPDEDETYVRRLERVFVNRTYNGDGTSSRTEVAMSDIDWQYTIVGNSTLPQAVTGGVLSVGHNAEFTSTGSTANFALTMENSFGSDCDTSSAVIWVEGANQEAEDSLATAGVVNLNADTTTITAKSTGPNAHSIKGIANDHFGNVNMNGKLVKIDVLTDSNDRPNFENVTDTDPFEAYGIENYSFGTIATSADTTLDIKVTGTGSNEDTFPIDDTGLPTPANIAGIYAEAGTLDFKGTTSITVEGNGNWAVGAQLWAEGVDQDMEDLLEEWEESNHNFNQTTTFGKATTINVRSEKSQAIGLLVGGTWFDPAESEAERAEYAKYLGKVVVTAEDDLTITAESPNENHRSVGIAFNRWGGSDAEVNLEGKTIITAEDALGTFGDELIEKYPEYQPLKEASFTINNSGELTLNGNVDRYTGKFVQTAGSTTINAENDQFFGGAFEMSGGKLTAEDYVGTVDNPFTMTGGSAEFNNVTLQEGGKVSLANAESFLIGGRLTVEDHSDIVFASDDRKGTITVGSITSRGNIDAGTVNFVVKGGEGVESVFTESTNSKFEAPADSVFAGNDYDHRFGALTFEGGKVTNYAGILVDGDVVLRNTEWTNQDGDLDVLNGKIVVGEGSTLINYGGAHADYWVLETGGTYYEEADEFTDGMIALGDMEGVMEYAGGQFLSLDGSTFRGWNLEESLTGEMDDGGVASQVVVSNGDYDWDTVRINMSERTEGERLEVTGGTLHVATFEAVKGDASVKGGNLHVDTLLSSGTFTMTGGERGHFTVGTFTGTADGNFTLAAGEMSVDRLDLSQGRLTIGTGSTLGTYSDQIFTSGLGEAGDNPFADGLVYSENHLTFAEGSSLAIRDAQYNLRWSESAGGLLGDGVGLVFTGTLVDDNGEEQAEIDYGDVQDGVTHANSDIVGLPAPAEDGTVTIDKSVGGKTLVVDAGSSVSVTGDKTLTLVGSEEGGELVRFEEGSANAVVKIDADSGLALGVAAPDVTEREGKISAKVQLDNGSQLTSTNGNFTLVDVATDGSDITVGSGTLTIESLKVKGENQLKGTLTAETLSGDGKVLVGSAKEGESASANLHVVTLDHTGTIFIDPAWTDGARMQDGSFLTVDQLGEDGTLKSKVVAGQHSSFVFGASKDDAVKAFASTGLSYGEKGDVTAVLYVGKAITVGDTGAITVDGSLSELGTYDPAGGSVTIAAKGLAMIDAAALTDVAAVTAKTVDIQKDAQIRIANLTGNLENAVLFEATDTNGMTVSDDIMFESNDAMIDVVLEQSGNKLVYSTDLKQADDVFAGFEGNDILQAVYDAHANNTHSSDRTIAFLSNMAAHGDHGVSRGDAIDIGNEAMALAAMGGVYNVALDASDLMNRSIDRRMSVVGTHHADQGVTFWADVFATRNEAESLYGSSGYSADLYGGVLGLEVALGNGKRVGAALTVGTGDAESKGAAFDIDNDADFVGFSVYGSHRLGNFNGKIDAGYMHTKSDLSATAFSVDIGDEVKADAWTVGIGGEYLFNVGTFDIVPHVGIRWTRLDVDGYTGAFETDDDTLDVFTAPIGVAFTGTFNAGAWKLSPMVDLSIVPSFGDDEATSTVSWRNVEDEVKTQVVDDAPFRASLGLNAEMGDWTVGASYDLGVGGDDRLDNAFTFKVRYQW